MTDLTLPPLRFPDSGRLTLDPKTREVLLRLQEPSTWEALRRGLQQMARGVMRAVQQLQAFSTAAREAAAEAANSPVVVEGLKAKYAVRAALDPAWVDPVPETTRLIRDGSAYDRDLLAVSRENRILIAVRALRAHAEHRPAPPPVRVLSFGGLVEHRVIRRHTFTVRAGS